MTLNVRGIMQQKSNKMARLQRSRGADRTLIPALAMALWALSLAVPTRAAADLLSYNVVTEGMLAEH